MNQKAIPERTGPESNSVRSFNRASKALALVSRYHMILGVNETSIIYDDGPAEDDSPSVSSDS